MHIWQPSFDEELNGFGMVMQVSNGRKLRSDRSDRSLIYVCTGGEENNYLVCK